jgi:hypothetical protein
VATNAAFDGIVAFAALLVILRNHTSTAAAAEHHGLTVHEWMLFGVVGIALALGSVITQYALTIRLVTLLHGEPTSLLRSWGQAFVATPRNLRMTLRRALVGMVTVPLRRDRIGGGALGLVAGRSRSNEARLRVAMPETLVAAEGLTIRDARERSLELIETRAGAAGTFDPPLKLANLLGLAGLVVVGGLGSVYQPVLGAVLTLIGLLLLLVVGGAASAAFGSALYVYLADGAATLGFLAEDLRTTVEATPPAPRRARRGRRRR